MASALPVAAGLLLASSVWFGFTDKILTGWLTVVAGFLLASLLWRGGITRWGVFAGSAVLGSISLLHLGLSLAFPLAGVFYSIVSLGFAWASVLTASGLVLHAAAALAAVVGASYVLSFGGLIGAFDYVLFTLFSSMVVLPLAGLGTSLVRRVLGVAAGLAVSVATGWLLRELGFEAGVAAALLASSLAIVLVSGGWRKALASGGTVFGLAGFVSSLALVAGFAGVVYVSCPTLYAIFWDGGDVVVPGIFSRIVEESIGYSTVDNVYLFIVPINGSDAVNVLYNLFDNMVFNTSFAFMGTAMGLTFTVEFRGTVWAGAARVCPGPWSPVLLVAVSGEASRAVEVLAGDPALVVKASMVAVNASFFIGMGYVFWAVWRRLRRGGTA